MLIGAAGTIMMNVLFGAASFWGLLCLFVAIRGSTATCRPSARRA